jgi:hypothetical protein
MPGLPFEVLYTIHFKDVFRISGNWVGVTQETIATFWRVVKYLRNCEIAFQGYHGLSAHGLFPLLDHHLLGIPLLHPQRVTKGPIPDLGKGPSSFYLFTSINYFQ